jgi:xanthine dehydrogenase YagS FAD-binding subunit
VRSARIFLSGAAPVPWRATAAEEAITGSTLDAATIEKAAAATVAGAEPLEHNGYKVPMFEGLMMEQLEAIKEPSTGRG